GGGAPDRRVPPQPRSLPAQAPGSGESLLAPASARLAVRAQGDRRAVSAGPLRQALLAACPPGAAPLERRGSSRGGRGLQPGVGVLAMRILVVTQMWPSPEQPDLGSFLVPLTREIEALGNEVEVSSISQRGGSQTKYLRLARDARAAARSFQ